LGTRRAYCAAEGDDVKKYHATLPTGQAPPDDGWRDLRDARGKLVARLDLNNYLLEIKRSDRHIFARFDLRDYFIDLRSHQKDE
jgi:hypothetical protein